jgi:hypothetical protein
MTYGVMYYIHNHKKLIEQKVNKNEYKNNTLLYTL